MYFEVLLRLLVFARAAAGCGVKMEEKNGVRIYHSENVGRQGLETVSDSYIMKSGFRKIAFAFYFFSGC